MRMWMVDPAIMCRQHLLGEHVEIHMLVSIINRGLNLDGYVKNNLLETGSIQSRHDALVEEMANRGYNHRSPLKAILETPAKQLHQNAVVDVQSALADLINRCPECRANLEK